MPGSTYKPCACPAAQTSSKHEILYKVSPPLSLRIKHALEVGENDKLFMNNP